MRCGPGEIGTLGDGRPVVVGVEFTGTLGGGGLVVVGVGGVGTLGGGAWVCFVMGGVAGADCGVVVVLTAMSWEKISLSW